MNHRNRGKNFTPINIFNNLLNIIAFMASYQNQGGHMFGKLLIIFFLSGSIANAHQPTHHHKRANHSAHIQKHQPRVSIKWEFIGGHWMRIQVKRVWVTGHYRGHHWIPGHWQTSRKAIHR